MVLDRFDFSDYGLPETEPLPSFFKIPRCQFELALLLSELLLYLFLLLCLASALNHHHKLSLQASLRHLLMPAQPILNPRATAPNPANPFSKISSGIRQFSGCSVRHFSLAEDDDATIVGRQEYFAVGDNRRTKLVVGIARGARRRMPRVGALP